MLLGMNMFLALLRAHFNPRYTRAKMILSQGQKHIYACERQLYCYIIMEPLLIQNNVAKYSKYGRSIME